MFTPPIQPKAGEVYVFSTGGNPEKLNDWRSDKYIWINRGGHGIPKNSKSLWKLWYKISLHASDRQGDSGFTRSAYIFKDKPDWPYVVIHYRGDESVFVPRPHGLSVTNTRPHERTCPSVLSAMKPKVLQNSCGKVYAENVTSGQTNAVHQGILNARDKKQVKNMATAQRNKYRVSHDEIFGSLQIVHHVNDFVKLLSIYPDIRVVLGSKDIFSELNRVLAVKSDEPALLSYDTTFNVGDFFVSVLVFRHVLFQNGVTIPAAFLIHDRKNQQTHDDFFRIIAEAVPNLKKGSHVIVTDREKVFTNAINKYLPNIKQVFCWNHLRRDLRHWLSTSTTNATSDDKSEYGNNLVQLMQCESIEAFEDLEAEMKLKWSNPMIEYFDNRLRRDILEHASRWILEECNVYDPYSGVTNNMSEGTNNVIEGLQNWHGAPLDAVILSMHYLQNYKYNEILRGRLNKGNFRLKAMHQNASLGDSDVEMPQDVCDPMKIIDLVKGDLNAILSEKDSETKLQEIPLDATKCETEDDEPFNNQKSLAVTAIGQRKVVLVPETGCFIVDGSKGDKYAVTLAPTEKCQCPALGTCYHILAARKAVGLEDKASTVVLNMSELIKRGRKRPNRLPGRKRPRPIDKLDMNESVIIPAPDSVLGKNCLDVSDHFASTPATKKKCGPIETPKSILKRKCNEVKSTTNRKTSVKKIRLALPKTVKRKSLMEAFSDSATQERQDSVNVSNDDLCQDLCDNVNLHETSSPVVDSVASACKSPELALEDKNITCEENTVNYSEKQMNNDHRNTSKENPIIISECNSPAPIEHTSDLKNKRIWRVLQNKKFSLSFGDKNDIKYDKKLNSDIINFSSGLLKAQFSEINGFQHCGYAPVRENGTWKYGLKMKPVIAPSAQIHHTGNDHWLFSFKTNLPVILMLWTA